MKPEWIKLGKDKGHQFLLSTRDGPIYCDDQSDVEALSLDYYECLGVSQVYNLKLDQTVIVVGKKVSQLRVIK